MALSAQNIKSVSSGPDDIDAILTKLQRNTRNSTLDTAARVAALYGAPEEAVKHILMLKSE